MIKESWSLTGPEAQLTTHKSHNGIEIIPDRLSVYTKTHICVFIFISDSNHKATISKVIRYIPDRFSERYLLILFNPVLCFI